RGGDGVCGGNRGTGGGGVRGGMGSLVGPLLSTLTFIAETTLERRDHAGVPKQRWRAETTLACRPHVCLKPRAAPKLRWRSEPTVQAQWCRHAGVVSTSQARPAGSFQCRGRVSVPRPRWSAETTLACWPQPRLKPRAAPKPRWRSETTVQAQWCRHAGVVSTLRADHQPAAKSLARVSPRADGASPPGGPRR